MQFLGQYAKKPSSFPAPAGFEGFGIIEEAGKASGKRLLLLMNDLNIDFIVKDTARDKE